MSAVEVYGRLQDNSIPWHVGDLLATGAVVGQLGQTGNAAGQDVSNAHVHFEVRKSGERTDPVNSLTNPCPWDYHDDQDFLNSYDSDSRACYSS